MIVVSDHALGRWAEHHPGTFAPALRYAVAHGTLIPRPIGDQLTGRQPARGPDAGTYSLAPDRRGLFVLAADRCAIRVITYLRLSDAAVAWCLAEFPIVEEAGAWRETVTPPRTVPGAMLAVLGGSATEADAELLTRSPVEVRALVAEWTRTLRQIEHEAGMAIQQEEQARARLKQERREAEQRRIAEETRVVLARRRAG
jgi:hypothetical protein